MNPVGSSVLPGRKLLFPGTPVSYRTEDWNPAGLNHISEVLVNASEPIIIQLLPVVGRKQAVWTDEVLL